MSAVHQILLPSLCWYMSARRTSLRAALSFRAPLSALDQIDLRVHYSAYFSNLLSATELLRETTSLQPKDFEARLHASLVFEGFQDGEANYSYLRELRNSIVHRGLNITSAAHIDANFPMILAEPEVQNQWRTKTFFAFDKYLLHVIAKCESVVGSVMLECLTDANLLSAAIDADADAAEYREAILRSHAMPDHFKTMALEMEFKPEWAQAARQSMVTQLQEALTPCDTTRPAQPR